jgi:hypothetical protein
MRQVTLGLALTAVLLASGCSGFNNNSRPRDNVSARTRWDGRNPTAASLVAYLNESSRQVQALQCTDVTLDCRQGKQSGVASGRMDCQKPRNFRLTAQVVGKPMVDLGSNENEFWYWISQADPPYVFHCSHEALAKGGVRMPFPFQPDMVLSALGIGEFDPAKQYDVRTQARTIELIETTRSPQGQPMQKITVFNRSQANGTQPQIAAHILRDAQGREICRASVTEVVRDPKSGSELPRRIHLVWPDQQIELKMKLDGIKTVPYDAQLAQSIYSRRNLASQPSFDLERWQADSPTGHVQRVGDPPR